MAQLSNSDAPDPPRPEPGGRDCRPRTAQELRARIARHPVTGSADAMRHGFRDLLGPVPDLPRHDLGGVPAACIGAGDRPVLWFHGGGYVFGSPETHGPAAAHLAGRAQAQVWLPDYPLAPEAPWPAQIEAAQAALAAFDRPVAVVGDSAGGHLALRLALQDPGSVASLALISPNTDRSGASLTRATKADAMNDDATDARLARLAFGALDDADPLLSPWRDDLAALPPTLILAASSEVLLDDALLLARAAAQAGRAVELRIWAGLFHLWPLWPEALPEARAALDTVADHLGRHPTHRSGGTTCPLPSNCAATSA